MFREVAIKAGKTHALRQPAPSDDRRAVERAIRGIGQDCERLLGMSGPSFRRAIMSASKGDQMDIVETIDKTTASLAELRDAVQNVITEKKTSRAEA
jgi:hypothetical protein